MPFCEGSSLILQSSTIQYSNLIPEPIAWACNVPEPEQRNRQHSVGFSLIAAL